MPDIRSFFGPKGGAAPAKPPAAKPEETKQKRTSTYQFRNHDNLANFYVEGRRVVEDSDDDEVVEYVARIPVTRDIDAKSS